MWWETWEGVSAQLWGPGAGLGSPSQLVPVAGQDWAASSSWMENPGVLAPTLAASRALWFF